MKVLVLGVVIVLFGLGLAIHRLWILAILLLGLWVLRTALRPRHLFWIRHLRW